MFQRMPAEILPPLPLGLVRFFARLYSVASVAQGLKVGPVELRAAVFDWLDVVNAGASLDDTIALTLCAQWICQPKRFRCPPPCLTVVKR
jgi:hypothetical protein